MATLKEKDKLNEFAMAALTGLLASGMANANDPLRIAMKSYELADAMLTIWKVKEAET